MTDDIVRIPLSCARGQDLWAVVDAADELLVGAYCWHVAWGRHGIYVKTLTRTDGRRRGILMHRLLMNPPDDMVIDHINRNGLDNRRSNLRIATQKQNMHNRAAVKGSASKYKGVFRNNNGRRWVATIGAGGTREHLGSYETEEEAARAFDWRSRQLYGEFALLNFPDDIRDTPPNVRWLHEERHVFGATSTGHDVVRYGTGGRYYLEGDGQRRQRVSMPEAARLLEAGQWVPGVPGGSDLETEIRRARKRARKRAS